MNVNLLFQRPAVSQHFGPNIFHPGNQVALKVPVENNNSSIKWGELKGGERPHIPQQNTASFTLYRMKLLLKNFACTCIFWTKPHKLIF